MTLSEILTREMTYWRSVPYTYALRRAEGIQHMLFASQVEPEGIIEVRIDYFAASGRTQQQQRTSVAGFRQTAVGSCQIEQWEAAGIALVCWRDPLESLKWRPWVPVEVEPEGQGSLFDLGEAA